MSRARYAERVKADQARRVSRARLGDGFGGFDLVALAHEREFVEQTQIRLVVHDQNGGFFL